MTSVPRMKDGGVYARIEYPQSATSEETRSLTKLVDCLRTETSKEGLPHWLGGRKMPNIWQVQGEPWLEVSSDGLS